MATSCPHCGGPLSRLCFDELASDHAWDLVCFDDGCPYYVRGWAWMAEHYGVMASYRFRRDGRSGRESPLPVWSPSALRGDLLPDDDDEAPPGLETRGAWGAAALRAGPRADDEEEAAGLGVAGAWAGAEGRWP